MKSLTRVLVVFWISQSVFCDILPHISESTGEELVRSNELTKAFSKVIQDCHEININQLFSSKMPFRSFSDNSLSGHIREYTMRCDDTEAKQEIFEKYDEIASYFKSCIDARYIRVVDNLRIAFIKLDKILCEDNSKNIAKDLSDESLLPCLAQNSLQVASCIFSEKEIKRLSKSVSQVVDFTAMLIKGNDNECGIVNRIEKCVKKTMTTCGDSHEIIGFIVKNVLKSFDCKITETTDLSQETTLEPLGLSHFMLYKENFIHGTMNCEQNRYSQKLKQSIEKLSSPIDERGDIFDNYMQGLKEACNVRGEENKFNQTIDDIVEVLNQCVKSKYFDFVNKITKSIKRRMSLSCASMDQHEKLFQTGYYSKQEHLTCIIDKAFPILGCVLSPLQVREIIADSSKFDDFAMSLFGGAGIRECRTIDKIKKCMIKITNSCSTHSTSKLLKYEFNLLMNTMQCKIDDFPNISMAAYMNEVSTI